MQVPDSAARQLIQENHFANTGDDGAGMLSPIPQAASSPLAAVSSSRPGTATGGVKGSELPVWSSTGYIPFASSRPTSAGGLGQQQNATSMDDRLAQSDGLKTEIKTEEDGKENAASIWDVPVTPRK